MTSSKGTELTEGFGAEDDVLKLFYDPELFTAVKYDRLSGYLSPTPFALTAKGKVDFLCNGGKIGLVTSIRID